jgi:hypothetical protein
MSTIVTRAGKGSPLTNTEVDSNFTNLNTDKIQVVGTPTDGQTLVWETANSRWVPGTSAGGGGPIMKNETTITSNQTIASGSNGLSVGPMTINTGVSVTVATGSKWVILNY